MTAIGFDVPEADLALEAGAVFAQIQHLSAAAILAETASFADTADPGLELDRFETALRLAVVKSLRLLELGGRPSPRAAGLPAGTWSRCVVAARRLLAEFDDPAVWAEEEQLVAFLAPEDSWCAHRTRLERRRVDAQEAAAALLGQRIESVRLWHDGFYERDWLFDGIELIVSDGTLLEIAANPAAADENLVLDLSRGFPGGRLERFDDPLLLCERHLRFAIVRQPLGLPGRGDGFGELQLSLAPDHGGPTVDVVGLQALAGGAWLQEPPRRAAS
jgi:hypothetical protein